MASRRLEVVIAGNANDAVRALGQTERAVGQFDRTSTRASGRFSSSWRSGVGQVGRAIGGLVAGAGLARFFSGAVTEAEEARSVMRQTAAVIESTGGVAGVTADHLSNLAGELSNLAAVDDETIQSAGNLLLTFRGVRAEGGIFDDALGSALDMSAAMDTELQPAIMMIGKALNDPLTGLSKLTRAGVTFTDQQKEQIAMMMYFGDTAGAQRIILEELAVEFGGAAEANATASEKFQVASDNIKESVGTILLPAMDRAAEAFGELSEWFTGLPEDAQKVIFAFGGVGAAALIMWSLVGGPAALAVLGLAGLAAGVVALGEAFPEAKAKVQDFFNSLPERWENLQKDLKPLEESIRTTFAGFQEFVKNLDFNSIKDNLREIGDNLQTLKDQLGITSSNGSIAINMLGWAFVILSVFIQGTIMAAKQAGSAISKLGAISLVGLHLGIILVQSFLAGATSAAKTAIEWLKKLGGLNVKVPGLPDLRNLLADAAGAAKSLYSWLSNLVSRTFSVKISVPSIPSWVPGFASGTSSAPPGMAWVGEEGPELVRLRGGERIWSNSESMRMVGTGRASGGSVIHVHLNGTATPRDGEAVVDALRNYERRNGPVPVRFAG